MPAVPNTPSNIKVIDWMENRAVPAGSDGMQTITSDEDVQVPTDEERPSQRDVYVAPSDHYLDNVDQGSHDEVNYMLSQIVRRDPKPTFTLDPVPVKARNSIHSAELYQSAMLYAKNIAQHSIKTVPATPGPHDDDDSGYPRIIASDSSGDTRDSAVNKQKDNDDMAELFKALSDSPPATADNIELQPFSTNHLNTPNNKSAAFMDKSTSSSIPYVENNVPNSDSTCPYTENNCHLISQCTDFTSETFNSSNTGNESCSVYKGYISEEKAKLLGSNAGSNIQSNNGVDHQIVPEIDSLSTSGFGAYVSHGEGYPDGVMDQTTGKENESKFINSTENKNNNTKLLRVAKNNHTTTESQHGSSVDSDCINFDDSPVNV